MVVEQVVSVDAQVLKGRDLLCLCAITSESRVCTAPGSKTTSFVLAAFNVTVGIKMHEKIQ